MEKALLVVLAINAEEAGSSPSFAEPVVNAVEVGCTSCSKSLVMEAQAPMLDVGSSLRSWWPSPDCSLEALRSLANDFLAKVRAEVDWVLFFGLGLKVDASSDVRRRMG